MESAIECRRWTRADLPRRALAIRLQALGDTVITLPYLQSIRRQYPGIELDLLTLARNAAIPRDLELFDRVLTIADQSGWRQALPLLALWPTLRKRRYDVVLDLQNHRYTRWLRRLLRPAAWSAFDRFSPIAAGERNLRTIEAAGAWKIDLDTDLQMRKAPAAASALLGAHGWQPGTELVILNPAGYFPSRAWPLENYVAFARLWSRQRQRPVKFVLLLLPALRDKAQRIATALGAECIDLTGAADAATAFAIIGMSHFMLSEDSGLMHMAWVQGVPTLALFGSSRKDWSRPLGKHADCLDSSDLECGPCGLPECRFGDNRCLTRYTPARVFDRALSLVPA
jgi:heptosyltransferase-2